MKLFQTSKTHFWKISLFFIFVIVLIFLSKLDAQPIKKEPSVRGVQTKVVISPTNTPTPTPTEKPVSKNVQPSELKKQYGGWYWQPQLGKAERWMGTDSSGKDVWIDEKEKIETAQSNPPASSSTNNPQSSQNTSSQNSYSNSPTTAQTGSQQNQQVVLDKSAGISATVQTQSINGTTFTFVTPTPESGPFDGTFTYDASNGSAKIVMNKPVKDCDGRQKDPNGGQTINGALRSVHGYVCELFFAPPNTPYYGGEYGAKVVSVNNEVKTFGSW